MNRLLRARAFRIAASSIALGALAAATGCDEESNNDNAAPSAQTSTKDAGKDTSTTPTEDAATAKDAAADTSTPDSSTEPDAAPPPQGCAAHATATFCDDFDSEGALTVGTTKWEFIEQSEQPLVTLSSTRAISAPKSLLTQIIDGTSPGAKFAKTLTKANFTEVTWDYDIYLDSVGTGAGFFLDDFQFTDDDRFGFRLVILADNSAIGTFRVEHNHPILGGGDNFEPVTPGTVQLGKWHHFKQAVKFDFTTNPAEPTVSYAFYIDEASTPAIEKTYASGSRAQIKFARFAGMPFAWDKAASAGLKIHWDNQVLELK